MRFAHFFVDRPIFASVLAFVLLLVGGIAYTGLPVAQYKQKADVWPLTPRGEILLSVIIESVDGIARAREIAAAPGVGQVFVGFGTLGQVFKGDTTAREHAASQCCSGPWPTPPRTTRTTSFSGDRA